MGAKILEPVKEKIYTLKEYFEAEEKSVFKNEFRNGKIVPMSGGTFTHGDILANLYLYLRIAMNANGEKYRLLTSDHQVFIPTYNHIVYPDAGIIFGKPKLSDVQKRAAINPTLIVEVLSNSTERYDRKRKFEKYKTLSSFKEYVLIDQYVPMVDVLLKTKDGWLMNTYIGLDKVVPLRSINCELKMTDIYENVEDLHNPQSIIDFN